MATRTLLWSWSCDESNAGYRTHQRHSYQFPNAYWRLGDGSYLLTSRKASLVEFVRRFPGPEREFLHSTSWVECRRAPDTSSDVSRRVKQKGYTCMLADASLSTNIAHVRVKHKVVTMKANQCHTDISYLVKSMMNNRLSYSFSVCVARASIFPFMLAQLVSLMTLPLRGPAPIGSSVSR